MKALLVRLVADGGRTVSDHFPDHDCTWRAMKSAMRGTV